LNEGIPERTSTSTSTVKASTPNIAALYNLDNKKTPTFFVNSNS